MAGAMAAGAAAVATAAAAAGAGLAGAVRVAAVGVGGRGLATAAGSGVGADGGAAAADPGAGGSATRTSITGGGGDGGTAGGVAAPAPYQSKPAASRCTPRAAPGAASRGSSRRGGNSGTRVSMPALSPLAGLPPPRAAAMRRGLRGITTGPHFVGGAAPDTAPILIRSYLDERGPVMGKLSSREALALRWVCVEIRSPSNASDELAMKTRAYLAAGACEVWVVTEAGEVSVHDADGVRAASRYPVRLSLPPPAGH
jgi:hypothetical protein